MYKILIPEYLGQQVVSGIRALKEHEIHVAYDYDLKKRLFRSKYIDHMHQITSSEKDPEAYVRDVIDLDARESFDLILPFGLNSFFALVNYPSESIAKKMLLPNKSAFDTANDKAKMNAFIRELGMSLPLEYPVGSNDDLTHLSREVRYPVVIKARSGSGVNSGVRYANNSAELLAAYETISGQESQGAFQFERPLVQEFIPGMIHDVCSLTINGKPQNLLTQVRRVMYPITGGVGALNTTTDDPELAELAAHILEKINWNGPAQVEFKFDPRDRKYKFVELNPKLWGTLDLSIQAGMNFPRLILEYIVEKKISSPKYELDMSYIFRYHQYACAKAQAKAIKVKLPYPEHGEIKHDMRWCDLKPDLWRMIGTYRFIFQGGAKNVNNNVDLSMIYDH